MEYDKKLMKAMADNLENYLNIIDSYVIIEGITKDEYDDAVMYDEVTFDEVLEKQLGIMDLNAMEMCRNNNIPIIDFNIYIISMLKL